MWLIGIIVIIIVITFTGYLGAESLINVENSGNSGNSGNISKKERRNIVFDENVHERTYDKKTGKIVDDSVIKLNT